MFILHYVSRSFHYGSFSKHYVISLCGFIIMLMSICHFNKRGFVFYVLSVVISLCGFIIKLCRFVISFYVSLSLCYVSWSWYVTLSFRYEQ